MRSLLYTLFIATAILHSNPLFASNSRLALIIGNDNYEHAEQLTNPARDAAAIAQKLRQLGFDVLEKQNLSLKQMRESLIEYNKRLTSDSISIVYYAGHGIQKNNHNYLIPVDADIQKSFEVEFSSIDLQMALNAIDEAKPRLSLVLLDACRDNPFEKKIFGVSRGTQQGRGLAVVNSVRSTILSFATQPGNIAVDGYGEHSPYATALLARMSTPGISVQGLLNQVGLDVMTETDGKQVPWFSSSPIPGYCLAGCEDNAKLAFNKANTPVAPPFVEKQSASPARLSIANVLQNAVQEKDLDTVKKIVNVSSEQELFLEEIFSSYSRLVLAEVQPTRSLSGGTKSNISNHVTFEISEATNRYGNRVLPAQSWRTVSFELK